MFHLIDNNSKFGTLVKLTDSCEIKSEKIALQVGRTVLTFVMKNRNDIKITKPQNNKLSKK